MKGTSDTIPSGVFEYGRSFYVTWGVTKTETGYEFGYAEIPKGTNVDEARAIIEQENDGDDIGNKDDALDSVMAAMAKYHK